MELFEESVTIRLKGPHGKYLWAHEDHYNVSQHIETKHHQALWRVERSMHNVLKTVRLKSCYETYLTASQQHHQGLRFLGFSGKKVTQMRPENVESSVSFEWEPVIDRGVLKMKSCYGTFLRGNPSTPPWRSSVSHDLPRHESHQAWLSWEVETVRAPNIAPPELVVGPIQEKLENQHLQPSVDRIQY